MRLTNLVALTVLAARVGAMYLMDDTNTTIEYSPSGRWNRQNDSLSYGGTYTVGGSDDTGCRTADNCQMMLPFRGSGITLYVSIVWALSFNATIDGIPVNPSHLDGVYGCCNSTTLPAYNVPVFSMQDLPFMDHVLTVHLVDTFGYLFDGNGSELRFDSALVNETGKPTCGSLPCGSLSLNSQRLGPFLGMAAVALALDIFY